MYFDIAIIEKEKSNMQLSKLKKKNVWVTKLKMSGFFFFFFPSQQKFWESCIYPSIYLNIIKYFFYKEQGTPSFSFMFANPWVMNDRSVCLHHQGLNPYVKQTTQRSWLCHFLLIPYTYSHRSYFTCCHKD